MGVAAIMALLASEDIAHPPLEALFTIDEETGMTGAFELEQGILKGEILLNLDTEDDDEFIGAHMELMPILLRNTQLKQ